MKDKFKNFVGLRIRTKVFQILKLQLKTYAIKKVSETYRAFSNYNNKCASYLRVVFPEPTILELKFGLSNLKDLSSNLLTNDFFFHFSQFVKKKFVSLFSFKTWL